MRKTSVRRFIHAVIDVLPLLVIPIFALNILHKETEPISIEVQEKVSVDFNQLNSRTFSNVSMNDINGLQREWQSSGTYQGTNKVWWNNVDYTWPRSLLYIRRDIYENNGINMPRNHKYFVYFWLINNDLDTSIAIYDTNLPYIVTTASSTYLSVLTYLSFRPQNNTNFENYFDFNITDLTRMYGEGNEPTAEQFIQQFPLQRYEYTESQKMLVNKPTTTTFNSTDIGSQFVYALYKPVHDYFNFNNLFNMGAIYDWIQLNLFSGTAPLPIFIIWNVIVYEFFVDLIFLLYGVFMFIIDFAEKCLERPFRR